MKRLISSAPSTMKTPRSTSATMIPTISAVCCSSRGTENRDRMITKTNRLSTERLYSVSQPAVNSVAGSGPTTSHSTTAKTSASPT